MPVRSAGILAAAYTTGNVRLPDEPARCSGAVLSAEIAGEDTGATAYFHGRKEFRSEGKNLARFLVAFGPSE